MREALRNNSIAAIDAELHGAPPPADAPAAAAVLSRALRVAHDGAAGGGEAAAVAAALAAAKAAAAADLAVLAAQRTALTNAGSRDVAGALLFTVTACAHCAFSGWWRIVLTTRVCECSCFHFVCC